MFKYFLLGIIAGFALGISVALVFNLSSSPATSTGFPETVNVTYQDEELKKNLSGLSKALSVLTESLDTLCLFSREKTNQAASQAISTKRNAGESSKALKASTDWAKVIDVGLAKALIENAKTPYDPGVSPLLNNAARKIRDLTDGYNNTLKEWEQRLLNVDRKAPDAEEVIKSMTQESREIEANYDAEKRRVVEEFRLALQSLQ